MDLFFYLRVQVIRVQICRSRVEDSGLKSCGCNACLNFPSPRGFLNPKTCHHLAQGSALVSTKGCSRDPNVKIPTDRGLMNQSDIP